MQEVLVLALVPALGLELAPVPHSQSPPSSRLAATPTVLAVLSFFLYFPPY